MPRPIRLLPLLATALLAACSHPPPPAASAQADAQPASPQATELRDSIQKPINRAKSVEDIVAKGNANQNAQGDQAAQGDEGASASSAAPP